MNKESRGAFLSTLRKMSKKGFYETLEYICKNESVHYADIMKFLIESKVVESRATVTLIVRGLLKLNLVERTVMDSRPVRTVYKSTKMGSEVLQLLQKIEAKTITSIEELTKLIDEDFKGIAHLCLIIEETTLKTAGFAVGLFDDARKQQTTINPENKN